MYCQFEDIISYRFYTPRSVTETVMQWREYTVYLFVFDVMDCAVLQFSLCPPSFGNCCSSPGEEAVKANPRCIKTHPTLFWCLWFRTVAAHGHFDWPRAAGSELAQLSYVTACDRQTWQPRAADFSPLTSVAVSPCRMDWFKLQRFEKVFNASSTRIVTRKGVKWVTGGRSRTSATGMWLSRPEGHRFSHQIQKCFWTRSIMLLFAVKINSDALFCLYFVLQELNNPFYQTDFFLIVRMKNNKIIIENINKINNNSNKRITWKLEN